MTHSRIKPAFNCVLVLVISITALGCAHTHERSRMTTGIANTTMDGRGDFDFLMGHWRVQNKRLVKRLAGSTAWESFEATAHARPLPGGMGNYDDFIAEKWRPGFVGMSLRVYSPGTKKWTIYWLDNVTGGLDPQGRLTVPVVGEFRNGIGTFVCEDEFEGKTIIVRYIWSNITQNSAHWEQAFSPDGGKTWETNWIMELARVGD